MSAYESEKNYSHSESLSKNSPNPMEGNINLNKNVCCTKYLVMMKLAGWGKQFTLNGYQYASSTLGNHYLSS